MGVCRRGRALDLLHAIPAQPDAVGPVDQGVDCRKPVVWAGCCATEWRGDRKADTVGLRSRILAVAPARRGIKGHGGAAP